MRMWCVLRKQNPELCQADVDVERPWIAVSLLVVRSHRDTLVWFCFLPFVFLRGKNKVLVSLFSLFLVLLLKYS